MSSSSRPGSSLGQEVPTHTFRTPERQNFASFDTDTGATTDEGEASNNSLSSSVASSIGPSSSIAALVQRASTENAPLNAPSGPAGTTMTSRPSASRTFSSLGPTSPAGATGGHSGSPFIYPIRSAVKVRPTTSSESGSFSNKSLESLTGGTQHSGGTGGGGHSRVMSLALPSPSDAALSSGASIDSRSPSLQQHQAQPQYYSHQLGSSPPALTQAGLERCLSQGAVSAFSPDAGMSRSASNTPSELVLNNGGGKRSSAGSRLAGGGVASDQYSGLGTMSAALEAQNRMHADAPDNANAGETVMNDADRRRRHAAAAGGADGADGAWQSTTDQDGSGPNGGAATIVHADVTAPAAQPQHVHLSERGDSRDGAVPGAAGGGVGAPDSAPGVGPSYTGTGTMVPSNGRPGSAAGGGSGGFAGSSSQVAPETAFTNRGDRSWEGQTTMRFSHVQTEEGHMVLTGRDGKLMRCEDEPIHIPGAIQSFGCLIVVREDEEGILVVRQCSENTEEILSLSPSYLFSLSSFLDCMDEDQADILWDNIEALNESPEELNETGPTVFRLHGWGQPGQGTGRARARKHWDVWCAAHRPEGQHEDGSPPLIVLEFELVHDEINPRDPPNSDAAQRGQVQPPSFSEEDRASSTGEIRAVRGALDVRAPIAGLRTVPEQECLGPVEDDDMRSSVAMSEAAGTDTSSSAAATATAAAGAASVATTPPAGSVNGNVSSAHSEVSSDATLTTANRGGGSGGSTSASTPLGGLEGQPYVPLEEDVAESTQSTSKPLKALARMRLSKTRTATGRSRRRTTGAGGPGISSSLGGSGAGDPDDVALDMFGILSQANEQLASQNELQSFLKVAVSIVREITSFSRVMIYQFDEHWNGQVVCELVNWNDTHDLYRGLHFPASDIPAQARAMYKINKVRLLYDRDQTTARMVCRDQSDLARPIDMTHCFLRAMSPIHIKYLGNMGVRASMSISIIAFDQLWGLIALHTYGDHGKRVSFPVRQLSRLIGDSVSRNIERLSYTRRLSARKLINTLPTDKNPSGYIISNAEDLLTLFDADFGIIAIGQEAKILGPLDASQEVLAITEYLRIKAFDTVVTSSEMLKDFPDMIIPTTLKTIAGLLVVPLTPNGSDFIAFLRKAQLRQINWAGKPFKEGKEANAILDPRKSFKKWSETVEGTCRAWKDEELETASVLCLVYGKFISVWRQREQAIQHNQMNKLLLSNASHEVRTPLNHIINYLELALDGPLDVDTRDNLSKSHLASKSLLFVINDLLDLTRQEEGKRLYLQEPFDLGATLREAVEMHESEAKRRRINFSLEMEPGPCMVLGDKNKVRQIVVNSVTNAVSHTKEGQITVSMYKRTGADMTTSSGNCDMEAEIVITDTGVGIPREKLEAIFREFEEVESVLPAENAAATTNVATAEKSDGVTPWTGPGRNAALGLGLAINARIVKNLGGQLRVQSTVGEGSRFTYFIPFASHPASSGGSGKPPESPSAGGTQMQRTGSRSSRGSRGSGSSAGRSEIDSLVEALNAPHLGQEARSAEGTPRRSMDSPNPSLADIIPASTGGRIRPTPQKQVIAHDFAHPDRGNGGSVPIEGSNIPLRSVKIDSHQLDAMPASDYFGSGPSSLEGSVSSRRGARSSASAESGLRALGSSRGIQGHIAPATLSSAQMARSRGGSSSKSSGSRNDRAMSQRSFESFGSNGHSGAEGQVQAQARQSQQPQPQPQRPPPPPPPQQQQQQQQPHAESQTPASPTSPPPANAGSSSAEDGSPGASSAKGSALASLLQKKKLGRSASPAVTKPSVPSLRALVVEDDPINAAILKKRLLLDKHTVSVAVNGEEGVQYFLQHSNEIDLILMDLQMPICNGRDACRRIRQIEKDRAAQLELTDRPASHVLNGGVPILAVSATLTEDMREELRGIGFDGWLLKPIDFLRLAHLKKGITNLDYRTSDLWHPGYIWERGGWLHGAARRSVH